MKEEYANNATVKLLLSSGFSEDYIMKGIENGEIDLKKSKSTEEMDRSEKFEKENEKNDEKHIKDLEKDKKEDEKDEKDLSRDKKAHEEKEKKDDMEKGITPDLMKSFGQNLASELLSGLSVLFKGMNARMDATDEVLKSMSKQAPEFRSEGLSNVSVLEKSIDSMKGEDGKIELSITRQRPAVKAILEKSLEDPEILKSYGEDAVGYLMCPEADTIGKGIAQYLFDKKNIKLTK